MNQREFDLHPAGQSQCRSILERLSFMPGRWVPMPELWRASGAFAVHSRIADLRKRGHTIEQKNERASDGTILSSYRLVVRSPGLSPSAPVCSPGLSPSAPVCSPGLSPSEPAIAA